MASAYSIGDKPSRSSGKSSHGKLSFFGFKSKKHPSLAIQDPPGAAREDNERKYANRPPSKSVSSTRSQAESSEPRTPVSPDVQRDYRHNSLLTLSDNDPFAAHAQVVIPRSPIVAEPNRLSVYSNSSTEYSKRAETNRVSYASTSSQGHDRRSVASYTRSPTSSDTSHVRKLATKKSTGDLPRSYSHATGRETAWESLMKYPNGIVDKNRHSQPDASSIARPVLRARGLTESGGGHPPNLFSDVKPVPERASPRVVVRQASMQRLAMPTSAPPAQRLPTPPAVQVPVIEDDDLPDKDYVNPLYDDISSILSRDDYMPNQHYIRKPDRSSRNGSDIDHVDLSSSPRPARTLKKSVSHNSLSKRSPSISGPASGSSTPIELSDKAPRKQRSFHHPRIPIPPIPIGLRHTNSYGSTSDNTEKERDKDKDKRGSTGGRKRLFSGSSFGRPTTSSSSSHFGDDDTRSIFSLPAEPCERDIGSYSKAPAGASFWEENFVSTTPPAEYVPKPIMTPAEMLQVEASVQESLTGGRHSRPRGMSVMSSETTASEYSLGEGLAAPFSSTTSLAPSSSYSRNMSSSQTTLTSMSSNHFVPSPISSMAIVPPTLSNTPPRPRSSRIANAETGIIPLSPPPRAKSRKKPSTETSSIHSAQRVLSIRKPSFLDIDDEVDRTMHSAVKKSSPVRAEPPPDGSFLDFARESFESERNFVDL
ncbi:hypothetical protein CYLTODRAFT_489163 [Cylindrobasidium torrendii FP15055 ss-10]|uniref:Uncharacterized protein n=1 Tax=Cylindrobasidium torrendii FP15055 ss-10 TaxID=1314674 RepID=A0A0D7BHL3_9AGAR|nr:hypothetical protein CYLTODRAFT_489163 [Cylindrobasidium torrendii FP15055 ss-10]